VQLTPFTPHVGSLEVWQWPLVSQHPSGHELALHVHASALQVCPGTHVVHRAPPLPHAAGNSVVTHELPLQQPEHEEDVLHTHCPLLLHASPLPQITQATPPIPHVAVPDVWHSPVESQHPSGQEWASHTHAPCALNSCWVPHGMHTPPFAPHAVFDAVTHTPLEQQPSQLVPPQVHDPPLQPWSVAQTPQALPFAPHAVVDCPEDATQLLFVSQHPVVHEVVVHSHVPEAPHDWPVAQPWHAAPAAPHVPID
jgi:hypothetical protein